MALALVDTNVLVYAHDAADAEKQARAIDLLSALHGVGAGCISAQSLAEFFYTVTRGRRPLLTPSDAAAQVERLAASWLVFDVTRHVVAEACAGVRDHRFSYWDAQIWAVARLHQVPIVLSEDFADGRRVRGVRFVNPFDQVFDLSTLLLQRRPPHA